MMPTTPARCRKMLRAGVAKKGWTKECVFYIKMLTPVGKETQGMVLAIDPGSKYDGYTMSGVSEVALQGMAVLPSCVRRRMKTRQMLRRSRRRRNCRRRKARFSNRSREDGWIAPSQLAKVQLRIRIMQRLCRLFPVTDIAVEDVRFNHYKKRWGKHFSTVEIGKAKVHSAARKLATLWLPRGWETAQARKDYGIEKHSNKSKLSPESHANDAWAMACWLFNKKPENTVAEFYIWRRQGYYRRQLHLQSPALGGVRRLYGGTTNIHSSLRKGDIVNYRNRAIGYAGGWAQNGKVVSLVGTDGRRIQQVRASTIALLARSPNIITERKGASAPKL